MWKISLDACVDSVMAVQALKDQPLPECKRSSSSAALHALIKNKHDRRNPEAAVLAVWKDSRFKSHNTAKISSTQEPKARLTTAVNSISTNRFQGNWELEASRTGQDISQKDSDGIGTRRNSNIATL